ncbi:endonuclease/exonuclease/phosphatase family protein [Myceligenerans indicum]|uniref:Endonuclease/exonuclease/phosphatase family protein n=1 Tax=Myceligenerans indicum TaxID=2593663 RepID=A0ABS1LMX9_9MICO|nr:endonuclease/exonuclease/phosphatase family protein [Myceligenerans indicum]MBL0887625.1 endonuclease/exonuclease/phosphatase family protein [Myceligenerans indicum]
MTQHSDAPAPPATEPSLQEFGETNDGDLGTDEARGREGLRAWHRFVGWFLWLCSLPVLAVLGSRAVPDDGITPVAQLVPFFTYALAAAVVLLVLAVTARRQLLSAVLVVCVGAGGFLAGSSFLPGEHAATGADLTDPRTLRLMTVNALYGSADAEWIVGTVRAEEVEILAVQELTPELDRELADAGLGELLPHQVTGKVETGSPAGSGLYSALPLRDERAGESSTFAMPSAVIDAGGLDVRIRLVHPVPPMPGDTTTWKRELAGLRQVTHADTTPQILLGDFNATYDHASFRDLLGGRFHDAWREKGVGLARTWPEGRSLPVLGTRIPALIPVDHVLVDDSMRVGDVRSRIVPGSDHRAVLSTVVVR